MPNSKQIVYLSQAQYAELIANGTITVDGVTVTYDENDIYVTPQAEPVTDVRISGTSIAVNGVVNIPVASGSTLGVMKVSDYNGVTVRGSDSQLIISRATANDIKNSNQGYKPITPTTQNEAVFYGLAKVAGHDEKNSTESLGTYTPAAKAAIQSMLGVSDLIATSEPTLVASKAYAIGDVFTANGKLYKAIAAIAANDSIITQDEGETISGTNAVETKVGEGFPHDVQVNGVSVVSNGVANVPIGSTTKPGLVQANNYYGTQIYGVASDGKIGVLPASVAQIKAATDGFKPIVPLTQDSAVFYGLAKIAGHPENASVLPVGQYTDDAKTAIRSMLGATSPNVIAVQDTQPTDTDTKIWLPETAETPVEVPTVAEMEQALAGKVGDVQVNGTSVVSEGVANVPIGRGQLGVVYVSTTGLAGLTVTDDGVLSANRVLLASDTKSGNLSSKMITPQVQHASTFYGLARAAGDTTQSSSSNAVGTYTDNAKASIKAMLGIQDGSTGTVDVTGTTPTITAVENTRYVCGEVTSLTFTPAASGICIVRFTSGSTVTVLTIPSIVKFPEWFDPTSLETNTIYEICVTDGVYGAVMSWAL